MDAKSVQLTLMIIAVILMVIGLFMPVGEMKVVINAVIVTFCVTIATIGTIMKERWSFIWWVNAIIWLINIEH